MVTFDCLRRGLHLRHVGYVVDRRTWRNGVDLFRNGVRDLPRTSRGCGGEPDSLKAEVIYISDLDNLLLRVGRVRKLSCLDWLELGVPVVMNFYLRFGFFDIHECGGRDLCQENGILCLIGSGYRRQNIGTWTIRRDLRKVRRQVFTCVAPRAIQ